MYSTIIVDDEKDQQDILSNMLQSDFPEYEIKCICSSVTEAINKIQLLKPQLVFLDVLIPPHTGFDLISSLKEIDFELIFCTSYQEYALKALKLSAVDYLLKPFNTEDLRQALNKYEEKIKLKSPSQHVQALLHNISVNTSGQNKIALPTLSGYIFVRISDIVHCKSDNAYTTFYLTDKTQTVVSRTMKECEELLRDYNFFRIHTSHLINLSFIKEYIKGEGGQVKMTDGTTLDVSRRKKEDFINTLNKL